MVILRSQSCQSRYDGISRKYQYLSLYYCNVNTVLENQETNLNCKEWDFFFMVNNMACEAKFSFPSRLMVYKQKLTFLKLIKQAENNLYFVSHKAK